AGKSTLLQIIAGVLNPTSGSIRVAGTISALLELGAGFNPDLTGRENVVLVNTIQGVGEKEIAERVSLVESFADVGLFFDQPMKVYSSGMYARVAFAHAINVEPDVLIVDEILGVGDAKFQEKCYNRLRNLRDKGVSIIFVSHSTDVIERNCESALLLDEGRKIKDGHADAVIAAYHDLLYGAKAVNPIAVTNNVIDTVCSKRENSMEQSPCPELNQFTQDDDSSMGQQFNYYNSAERRLGSGDARIIDFLLIADGQLYFDSLKGTEILTIYVKVKFGRDVERPKIGWAIASIDGIHLAGTNTELQNIDLAAAREGEAVIYVISLAPKLAGGHYFVDLGVGERDKEGLWKPLDNRRSLIHLAIADSMRCSGFFEIASDFSTLPRLERAPYV
ncbi:MAG: ABC transporter ATP-binding protein, partial [Nitrospira sp.]|nr:ABC transporter ATP-binding protein [Nitrospira sp.]